MKLFSEFIARIKNGWPIGDGYRIKQLNRDLFRISSDKNTRTIDVVVERSFDRAHQPIVLPEHWNPPNDNEKVKAEDAQKIESIISDYFRSVR